MDYKFLDKVVGQIFSETRVDEIFFKSFGEWRFFTPVMGPSVSLRSFLPGPLGTTTESIPLYRVFSDHCRDVYGLNGEEIEYVWEEWKKNIKDKLVREFKR